MKNAFNIIFEKVHTKRTWQGNLHFHHLLLIILKMERKVEYWNSNRIRTIKK